MRCQASSAASAMHPLSTGSARMLVSMVAGRSATSRRVSALTMSKNPGTRAIGPPSRISSGSISPVNWQRN